MQQLFVGGNEGSWGSYKCVELLHWWLPTRVLGQPFHGDLWLDQQCWRCNQLQTSRFVSQVRLYCCREILYYLQQFKSFDTVCKKFFYGLSNSLFQKKKTVSKSLDFSGYYSNSLYCITFYEKKRKRKKEKKERKKKKKGQLQILRSPNYRHQYLSHHMHPD